MDDVYKPLRRDLADAYGNLFRMRKAIPKAAARHEVQIALDAINRAAKLLKDPSPQKEAR